MNTLKKAYNTIELFVRVGWMLISRKAMTFLSPQNNGLFIIQDADTTICVAIGQDRLTA